jgi:Rrf2 family protein
MQRLTANGILDSEKGHHGGFMLARSRVEIRFIDVLRAVDFEPGGDHCVFGLENCDAQSPCPLHSKWSVPKEQIEEWARSHTLAESLESRTTPLTLA